MLVGAGLELVGAAVDGVAVAVGLGLVDEIDGDPLESAVGVAVDVGVDAQAVNAREHANMATRLLRFIASHRSVRLAQIWRPPLYDID